MDTQEKLLTGEKPLAEGEIMLSFQLQALRKEMTRIETLLMPYWQVMRKRWIKEEGYKLDEVPDSVEVGTDSLVTFHCDYDDGDGDRLCDCNLQMHFRWTDKTPEYFQQALEEIDQLEREKQAALRQAQEKAEQDRQTAKERQEYERLKTKFEV